MKNKIIVIPYTDITLNGYLIENVPMEFTMSNGEINYYYPKELSIYNTSGVVLGLNIFSSTEEYNEFLQDATNFHAIRIYTNSTYANQKVPKIEKVLIRKFNGNATSAIDIQFINYQDN